MLISCPNCKTTFTLSSDQLGVGGRKLKCSKCANVWMQAPTFDQKKLDNLLKVEVAPANNLPVSFKKEKFRISYAVSAVILLLITTSVEIMKQPEKYPALNKMLGLQNYEGLRFHDFKVESEIVDKKVDFHLKGSIINFTDREVELPAMNVKAYSQGGRVMAESKIELEQKTLGPFEKLDILPDITKISGNAEKLELSFENWLEELVR